MVDFLSSASCNFCSNDKPSMRGMLMSDMTRSTSGFPAIDCKRLDAVAGEHECNRSIADLPAKLLQYQRFEIGLVIDDKDGCSHAARPSRLSISWRSSAKSIGFVSSPSAPRSSTLRLVSASP